MLFQFFLFTVFGVLYSFTRMYTFSKVLRTKVHTKGVIHTGIAALTSVAWWGHLIAQSLLAAWAHWWWDLKLQNSWIVWIVMYNMRKIMCFWNIEAWKSKLVEHKNKILNWEIYHDRSPLTHETRTIKQFSPQTGSSHSTEAVATAYELPFLWLWNLTHKSRMNSNSGV